MLFDQERSRRPYDRCAMAELNYALLWYEVIRLKLAKGQATDTIWEMDSLAQSWSYVVQRIPNADQRALAVTFLRRCRRINRKRSIYEGAAFQWTFQADVFPERREK